MIESTFTADARRRAHLEGRRAELAAQADTLRAQASDLWRTAWDTERGHGDALPIKLQAMAIDDERLQALKALQAVEDELRGLQA